MASMIQEKTLSKILQSTVAIISILLVWTFLGVALPIVKQLSTNATLSHIILPLCRLEHIQFLSMLLQDGKLQLRTQ